MNIKVNDSKVLAKLNKLKGKISNASPLLKAVALFHLRETARTFQSEGKRDEHVKWKEFSPHYKRRPSGKMITSKSKLLQDTGTLKQSFKEISESPFEIVWGSLLDYAPKHQFGEGKTPAREMLFITEKDKEMMKRLSHNWIKNQILSVAKGGR